jgi:hypothetical protein
LSRSCSYAPLHHVPMPDETRATIHHPAALATLRTLFKPR